MAISFTPFIYDIEDDLLSNTYVLFDSFNNAVIIDPGSEYNGIIKYLDKHNLYPKAILLTHGHVDHIGGVNILLNSFDIPIYIHEEDKICLKNPHYNLSMYVHKDVNINKEPIIINDNDRLSLLEEEIIVIYTPFHTKGSVCYYLKNEGYLFSGDTLFNQSIGRDDFSNSSPKTKYNSLAKLMQLPDNVKVMPGHGKFTSIGEERNKNPFIKQL